MCSPHLISRPQTFSFSNANTLYCIITRDNYFSNTNTLYFIITRDNYFFQYQHPLLHYYQRQLLFPIPTPFAALLPETITISNTNTLCCIITRDNYFFQYQHPLLHYYQRQLLFPIPTPFAALLPETITFPIPTPFTVFTLLPETIILCFFRIRSKNASRLFMFVVSVASFLALKHDYFKVRTFLN